MLKNPVISTYYKQYDKLIVKLHSTFDKNNNIRIVDNRVVHNKIAKYRVVKDNNDQKKDNDKKSDEDYT